MAGGGGVLLGLRRRQRSLHQGKYILKPVFGAGKAGVCWRPKNCQSRVYGWWWRHYSFLPSAEKRGEITSLRLVKKPAPLQKVEIVSLTIEKLCSRPNDPPRMFVFVHDRVFRKETPMTAGPRGVKTLKAFNLARPLWKVGETRGREESRDLARLRRNRWPCERRWA